MRRKQFSFRWTAIVAVILLFFAVNWWGTPQVIAQTSAVPSYTVADIGVLPGFTQMTPAAISIRGSVVGYAANQTGITHAFFYRAGRLIDLGATLGANNSSQATAINSREQIIGTLDDSSGQEHGFLYSRGQVQVITVSSGRTTLRGINDIGQIVGNYGDATSFTGYAFLRQPNGAIVYLPNLGNGYFEADAINNLGQIAGTVFAPNPVPDGFFYQTSAALVQAGESAPHNLGSLGGPANGCAVNLRGEVVGSSLESYNENSFGLPSYAVLYAAGQVINLGLPANENSPNNQFESYALGINDYGQIVGASDLTDSGEDSHGLLFVNGQVYDLNDLIGSSASSYTVTEAVAINDFGQIVATALNGSGAQHVLILTPGSVLP